MPVYTLYKLESMEIKMAIITRWGNSNGGIRIPQAILDAAGLRVGDDLGCRVLDSGDILLSPRKPKNAITGGQIKTPKPCKPDVW